MRKVMRLLAVIVIGNAIGWAQSSSLEQGLQAAQRQDWPAAKRAFLQAHLSNPSDPRPLFNLGLAHAKTGNEVAAVAWFGAYLAAAPSAENASQVREQMTQLRALALKKVDKLFDSASKAAQVLSGKDQTEALDSIKYYRNGSIEIMTSGSDEARSKYAEKLLEYGDTSEAMKAYARMGDAGKRGYALASAANSLAYNKRFSEARDFAKAIPDEKQREQALGEVNTKERIYTGTKQADALIEAGKGDQAMVVIEGVLSPNPLYELDHWIEAYCKKKDYVRAMQLQARAPLKDYAATTLGTLLAGQLRNGDLAAATETSRRLLGQQRVPRQDWLNAEDALRKAEYKDVEGGLRVIANRIADVSVKKDALKSVIALLESRKDESNRARAQKMLDSMPYVSADRGSMIAYIEALALTGDWEAALAVAHIGAGGMGIYGFGWLGDGWIRDVLDANMGRDADYGALAFIAVLQGKKKELERTRKEVEGLSPIQRIYFYQNISWAYCVMGRFDEALKAAQQLPPGQYGQLMRAQLVAAIAHRQAWAGRPMDGYKTLDQLPSLAAVEKSWPGALELKVEALLAIAKVLDAQKSPLAEQAYAGAASALKNAQDDAALQQLSEGKWTLDHLKRIEGKIRTGDPKADQHLGAALPPALTAWTEAAVDISAQETPEDTLKRLNMGNYDKLHMPQFIALTAHDLFQALVKIDVASRRANP